MKIEISKSTFMKTVSKSVGFIDEHAISDIFKNFLIEVINNEQIAITATDANAHSGIMSILNIDYMKDPKSFLVRAKKLNGILKSIDGEELSLELNERQQLTIKSNRAKFELASSSISEYIDRPQITGKEFELKLGDLLFLIKKTLFAVSPDMTKNSMRGGFIKYENSKLIMVATDGFQLAHSELEVNNPNLEGIFGKEGILIAKEDLIRLRKILEVEDPSTIIKGILKENTISLSIDDPKEKVSTTVWLRLLSDKFVSYSKIFRDEANIIKLEKNLLKSVLNRASQTMSKDIPILTFSINNNSLLIKSNDEYSFFSETMEIKYNNKEIILGISIRHLGEIIPLIDSQFILLDILSDEDVIIIKSFDNEKDRNYFYILMPMNLN